MLEPPTVRTLSRLQADSAQTAFLIHMVAVAMGVPAREIAAEGRRGPAAARARQLAMYLAYVVYQWPLQRVGLAFGRDRTTAGHACRQIEDLRDDPEFDARVAGLEACIRANPGSGVAA